MFRRPFSHPHGNTYIIHRPYHGHFKLGVGKVMLVWVW
jgi:hypothetical protein